MKRVLPVALILILTPVITNIAQNSIIEAQYEYVAAVYAGDDVPTHLLIQVKGSYLPVHGCPQRSWAHSKYPITDERTKAWMTIALASFLGRQSVSVKTQGCTTDGFPVLIGIQVQDTYSPPPQICPEGQRRCPDGSCVPKDLPCPCPAGQHFCPNLEPPRCVPTTQKCPPPP